MTEVTAVVRKDDQLDEVLISHLDSAYNLARWLVRDRDDAEDVVQEAYLRAVQYSGGFRGGDARAWLLAIVRNTSYRWLARNRRNERAEQFDENIHVGPRASVNPAQLSVSPEHLLLQTEDTDLVEKALRELPVRFREILVLRELEGLSYKEIADVMSVPAGTVMSSLSRARQRFRQALDHLRNNFASGRVLITESAADVVRSR